ncbi:MAG: FecR domain-containing protein [Anaerolineales bacterium]
MRIHYRAWLGACAIACAMMGAIPPTIAQEQAAVLEVLAPGVEVRRVNTETFLPIQVEAIVGVGDTIRTDESGQARIIFFADGTETDLLSETEYRIARFEADDAGFTLSVEVLAGQTVQRLNRLVDDNSAYDVQTPGMDMVARGTVFRVRVEPNGRSAMLVDESQVEALAEDGNATVSPGSGVRSARNEALSDVVVADTFESLDAALDGCSSQLPDLGDVRVNVRQGPGEDFPRVGSLPPAEIETLMGVVENDIWYRIMFRNGFGWVRLPEVTLANGCAGLRVFPATHGPEDAALYEDLGDIIAPEDLLVPTPTE